MQAPPLQGPIRCRPLPLQTQEESPRPVKCGLIWSLNIQTPNSGGGRKPSCQFYMEYLRHLRVTRPFSRQFLSIQQKCTLLPGSPAQHLQVQLQSHQACLLPGTNSWRDLPALGWGFPQGCMAVLPLRTRQLRTCLIYQLHLKSSTTRTNILQFPLLQLLHSLCLNY